MRRLLAAILGFCLLLSGPIFSPVYAVPAETRVQMPETGIVRITATNSIALDHSGQQLLLTGPGSTPALFCQGLACRPTDSVQISTNFVEQIELSFGHDKLSFDLIPTQPFELTAARNAADNAISLSWAGQVSLTAADIAGPLVIRHGGHQNDSGYQNDSLTTGSLAADQIDIMGGNVTINGAIEAMGPVTVLADNKLRIRDRVRQAARIEAAGPLTLQAPQIDIFALTHPESALISGGDMVLRSQNTIHGDAHYLSGGQVRFEQLDGQAANLFSPYDPIVLASGDVSLGDYSGASLHVLAGGKVTMDNVTITGVDTGANTINPGNGTALNGVEKISVLAKFNLSNNMPVTVDGSTTPTLDVRAGIDWSTFNGGAPTDQVIPNGAVSPRFGGATGADITVSGLISITQPDGLVLLTNQYRPNKQAGSITTAAIAANTTTPSTNGGAIIIDSRGNVTTGALNTSAEVTGNGVTVGNGGPITLLAPNGKITTSGAVSAFTRVPGNNSGSVGNGGSIFIAALSDVAINNGTGGIDAFAFANSAGNAGNGGNITISGGSLSASRLHAYSFAGSGGVAGQGGTISINATSGAVNIVEGGFVFASIQTYAQDFGFTAGDAGSVAVMATSGINLSHGIDARGNGANSRGGDISLTTSNGNISTDFLRSFAANNTTPGNAGHITVRALNGGITTGDIDAYSNAFTINNPSQNGGNVTLEGLNGNVVSGHIINYSEARGMFGPTGNGGHIEITATNGGITANGDLQSYARSSLNNSHSSDAGTGGNITLQASGNINVAGNLESYSLSQITGNTPVEAESSNGGHISVTSSGGNVSTGNLNSYSSAQSQTGNGGNITVSALSGISINSGAGVINSYTSAFTDTANAGNAGDVTLDTDSGNLQLEAIVSQATAQFSNNAGNGGDINLSTGNGTIDISGNSFNALNARVGAGNLAGEAGDIVLNATHGINLSGLVAANTFGDDGNGGDVTLTTTNGNIASSDPINASATYNDNTGEVGNGGHVLIQALNGSVVISDVWTYSHANFIHTVTHNGGNITINAHNGDANFGDLLAHSESRGAQGDTGDSGLIMVAAVNGSISGSGDVRADSFSLDNNTNSGDVGNSQGIIMNATHDISIAGGLQSFARSSKFDGTPTPTGSAGNAGPVALTANHISISYIDARSIAAGTIGSGGDVQIMANQFFRGTGTFFGSDETISVRGLPGTGAISITHGGAGLTPFIVGDAATNGVSGELTSADSSISPVNSYLDSHFEPPNIWINAIVPLPTINKTAHPNLDVLNQGEVTYSIIVSNLAPVDAENLSMTDILPPEVNFNRWKQQNGATIVNDEIFWNGTVPAQGSITVEFVVDHVGTFGDTVINTATFSQGENNGSAMTTFTVRPAQTILDVIVFLPVFWRE